MNINIHDWLLRSKVEEQIKATQSIFDPELINCMSEVRNRIDIALSVAMQIEARAKQEAKEAKAEAVA